MSNIRYALPQSYQTPNVSSVVKADFLDFSDGVVKRLEFEIHNDLSFSVISRFTDDVHPTTYAESFYISYPLNGYLFVGLEIDGATQFSLKDDDLSYFAVGQIYNVESGALAVFVPPLLSSSGGVTIDDLNYAYFRGYSDAAVLVSYDLENFPLPVGDSIPVLISGGGSSTVDLASVLDAISALDTKVSSLDFQIPENLNFIEQSLNGNGSRYKDGENVKVVSFTSKFKVISSQYIRTDTQLYTVMYKLQRETVADSGTFDEIHYIPEQLVYIASEVTPTSAA